ncbi:MAG: VTT domain-containing protein [Candidatus Nomurabacteria bacterium]|nr:MAG: VTT domain-containing protein [Candidatus Nomurabacteria bacterium]
MWFTPSEWIELLILFFATLLIPTFNFVSPFRPILLIIAFATHIHFLVVGVVASVGATLGTLPLYYVGRKTQEMEKVQTWLQHHSKWKRLLERVEHSTFLVLLLLLWTPLPDQLVGLYGGFERYTMKKFLLANFIGRAVWYIPLAFAATIFDDPLSGLWHWLTGWL